VANPLPPAENVAETPAPKVLFIGSMTPPGQSSIVFNQKLLLVIFDQLNAI
jgi:hypothetical protein